MCLGLANSLQVSYLVSDPGAGPARLAIVVATPVSRTAPPPFYDNSELSLLPEVMLPLRCDIAEREHQVFPQSSKAAYSSTFYRIS